MNALRKVNLVPITNFISATHSDAERCSGAGDKTYPVEFNYETRKKQLTLEVNNEDGNRVNNAFIGSGVDVYYENTNNFKFTIKGNDKVLLI